MSDSRHIPQSFVVIGTSAGGAAALSQIFKDLPADFPGALMIVMHTGERNATDWLAERLAAVGRLSVKVAEAGERIRQTVAYVAPPGYHLLVEDGHVRLSDAPHEQHVRPAIDALFRSAAQTFGKHTIGVILTGMLRDGTAGLRAVDEAGGITVVQNPADASAGEMPRSAMRDLMVDYCIDLAEIGPLLDLLVRRASAHKEGVLETGLASSIRFLKDRVRMLAALHDQSRGNPKTARFLESEIAALDQELAEIEGLIPSGIGRKSRRSVRRS